MFVGRRICASNIPTFMKIHSRTIIKSIYPDISMERTTFASHLFSYCDKYSNNIACIDDKMNIKYSYGDFKNSVINIASSLTKRGVTQGSMLGIISSNSPEYLMLILAISGMGCTTTICNQNFTENEIRTQLLDSKPSILFTNDEYVEKISRVAKELPFVQDIYLIGNRKPGYKSVEDLINDNGNMSPLGAVEMNLDEHVALLPYSSGTTGLPKGVMLTHTNLVSNFRQIPIAHTGTEKKTMMVALPLYHIYATIIIPSMAFSSGSTMVFLPRFSPVDFLSAIEKYRVSLLHLVPPQILFLLNYPDVGKYDLSSVEKCFSAAAPLDSVIENQLNAKFRIHQPDFDVYQGYGLTELSPISHLMPNKKRSDNHKGSVGLLVPNLRCKVVDLETRKEVSANQKGELLIQGPNVMKGYFGKNRDTENAFENNWFKTGDVGYYDEDDYFYINDRIKELIKVKGYQVAPAELEATLLSIPEIADCAVIGVPDDRNGEAPRAFVVRKGDIQEKQIHDFMCNNLSSYKQLKGGIFFIDEIPKSPSGKILRRLLKDFQK